jgi:uncharacterized protein
MQPELVRKERRLREIVRGFGRVVVAFSGGVDSALVLHVATQELGENAIGITAHSASLPEHEETAAVATARASSARHEVVVTREVEDPAYAANPPNRCYFCKRELYGRLVEIAASRGGAVVVDGFNVDDASDWRPGRKAASEFGVRSPLAEAAFGKNDVRALARRLGLSVWDKPAMACLSSRFPYGTRITLELLAQVERAERAVLDAGLRECRVRHHGDIARIEVPLDCVALLVDPARRERIVEGVRAAGYRYVTVDLDGYARGSLNRK